MRPGADGPPRALILGASCALGLALGEALLVRGGRVVGAYRDAAGLERIKRRWSGAGRVFETLYLDLSRFSSIEGAIAAVGRPLDVAVDFAHGDLEGLIGWVTGAAAADYFAAQIGGRYAVLRQICRLMLAARQGRLLFVSSRAAVDPNPGQGFYAAAKLAGEALYRNAHIELSHRGIHAFILRPGYVDCGRGRRFLQSAAAGGRSFKPVDGVLSVAQVVNVIVRLLENGDGSGNGPRDRVYPHCRVKKMAKALESRPVIEPEARKADCDGISARP